MLILFHVYMYWNSCNLWICAAWHSDVVAVCHVVNVYTIAFDSFATWERTQPQPQQEPQQQQKRKQTKKPKNNPPQPPQPKNENFHNAKIVFFHLQLPQSFSFCTWKPGFEVTAGLSCSTKVIPIKPSPVLRLKRRRESSGNMGSAVDSFQRPTEHLWNLGNIWKKIRIHDVRIHDAFRFFRFRSCWLNALHQIPQKLTTTIAIRDASMSENIRQAGWLTNIARVKCC